MTDSDDSLVQQSDLPVVSSADVAAEWSPDLLDPSTNQPLLQAIIDGQAAMLLAYQEAADTAAAQSDPLRATNEYLDEIGWEYAVYRQKSEDDDTYRARFFYEATVSPEDIIAVANGVLAPYTSTSCVYFEHLDGWHVRETYYDVVSASNTSPIIVGLRYGVPPYFQSGTGVTISGVGGNTAANASWVATPVMGPVVASQGFITDPIPPTVTLTGTPFTGSPIQLFILTNGLRGVAYFYFQYNGTSSAVMVTAPTVALPGTGLTAHFSAGSYTTFTTYTASPYGLSLTGSTGNGAYTGGGSAVFDQDDPSANPSLWSSHVYGDSYANENYPDRYYDSLPHRFSAGARAFSDAKGRLFWLLAPDISGIDANVAGLFDGYLDILYVSSDTPVEVTTAFDLPPELVTGSVVTITGTTQVVALSGGATFHVTNGSTTVTCAGGSFLSELSVAVPTALADNARIFFANTTAGDHYQVAAIASETSLTLDRPYTGPTSTTAQGLTYAPLCDAGPLPGQQWQITVTGPNTFTLNTSTGVGSGPYSGGGSIQTSVSYSQDGFYAGAGINLVGTLSVSHGVTGTLDATHQLALCHSSTGTTSVKLPASPTAGENAAVQDVDGQAGTPGHWIFVQSQGGILIERPFSPGTFALTVVVIGSNIEVIWVYDATRNLWVLNRGESYVWSVSSTAADVYGTLVADVNAIRGQSMRWFFWVDPKLH